MRGALAAFATLALTTLDPTGLPGQEAAPDARPRIGLVLGGGGARGTAHVGVLQVLEELQVPIDAIAGTSIGSIVGALYACGWSPAEMAEEFTTIDWPRTLDDYPLRSELSFRRKRDDAGFLIPITIGFDFDSLEIALPPGALGGRNVEFLLAAMTSHVHAIDDFDRLPIPFRCVAADLTDGHKTVFRSGRLSDAVRASMSLPAVFAPFEIDGRTYVDGGIVDNLPVDVARAMGVDIVIAVDVGTPLRDPDKIGSLLGVTDQVIGIMMMQNIDAQRAELSERDVLITPVLDEITALDFSLAALGIQRGREAAAAATDALNPLGIDDERWTAWLQQQRRERPPPRITGVQVDNRSQLDDELIRDIVTQPIGARLDLDRLGNDLSRLGGYEVFDRISFSLDDRPTAAEPGETTAPADLMIRADDRELGPQYFQFGVALANDFQGDSEFNAAIRHTWLPVNSLGGEWRNEVQVGAQTRISTEFYQPLDATQRWFVVPRFDWLSEEIDLLQDGVPVAVADVGTFASSIAAGRIFADSVELRLGYAQLESETEVELLGLSGTIDSRDGFVFARVTIDTLDSLNYPRGGWFVLGEGRIGNDGLGGQTDYSTAYGRIQKPVTVGETTFLANIEGGYSWNAATVLNNRFRLGGFTRLSGLEPNELFGDHYMLGSLVVFHRLSRPATRFSSAFYVGGSIEAGQIWNADDSVSFGDLRLAGSLFVGADTLLGPLYLGVGLADEGRRAAYLYLGQQF